ncbi:hypothetical protein QYM36_004979, partial [Artemia franciscana]
KFLYLNLFKKCVGILGGGVSMLVYHYESIPLLRQFVEQLRRLEHDQRIFSNLTSRIWQQVFIVISNGFVAQQTSVPR